VAAQPVEGVDGALRGEQGKTHRRRGDGNHAGDSGVAVDVRLELAIRWQTSGAARRTRRSRSSGRSSTRRPHTSFSSSRRRRRRRPAAPAHLVAVGFGDHMAVMGHVQDGDGSAPAFTHDDVTAYPSAAEYEGAEGCSRGIEHGIRGCSAGRYRSTQKTGCSSRHTSHRSPT
jgi:hypothetical protein